MHVVEPTAEHHWLQKLVGEWSFEGECKGPDDSTSKYTGKESVRSLDGLWTIGEGEGEMPGGGVGRSIITLGYDPARGKFVGTFVGGMMTHLWIYEGSLDAAKKVLTLDAEGPSFTGEGMSLYQDIFEFVSDDHRTLRSQIKMPDGNWVHFMTAHYRRKK